MVFETRQLDVLQRATELLLETHRLVPSERQHTTQHSERSIQRVMARLTEALNVIGRCLRCLARCVLCVECIAPSKDPQRLRCMTQIRSITHAPFERPCRIGTRSARTSARAMR